VETLDTSTPRLSGITLPSNNSQLFAPEVDSALRAGIAAELAVLRGLLK